MIPTRFAVLFSSFVVVCATFPSVSPSTVSLSSVEDASVQNETTIPSTVYLSSLSLTPVEMTFYPATTDSSAQLTTLSIRKLERSVKTFLDDSIDSYFPKYVDSFRVRAGRAMFTAVEESSGPSQPLQSYLKQSTTENKATQVPGREDFELRYLSVILDIKAIHHDTQDPWQDDEIEEAVLSLLRKSSSNLVLILQSTRDPVLEKVTYLEVSLPRAEEESFGDDHGSNQTASGDATVEQGGNATPEHADDSVGLEDEVDDAPTTTAMIRKRLSDSDVHVFVACFVVAMTVLLALTLALVCQVRRDQRARDPRRFFYLKSVLSSSTTSDAESRSTTPPPPVAARAWSDDFFDADEPSRASESREDDDASMASMSVVSWRNSIAFDSDEPNHEERSDATEALDPARTKVLSPEMSQWTEWTRSVIVVPGSRSASAQSKKTRQRRDRETLFF